MLRELARMASKWRIDGVFSDMRIEKKGDKFSRELDFWLISILWLYHVDNPEARDWKRKACL